MYLVEGCDGAAPRDAESEDGEARGGDEAVPVPRLLQPDSGGRGIYVLSLLSPQTTQLKLFAIYKLNPTS